MDTGQAREFHPSTSVCDSTTHHSFESLKALLRYFLYSLGVAFAIFYLVAVAMVVRFLTWTM